MTTIFKKGVVITSLIMISLFSAKGQVVRTIAGTGVKGNTGNNGPAIAATLYSINGLYVDPSGNVFMSDNSSNVVRKIDQNGIISCFAGTGSSGYGGDGGPASAANFSYPLGIIGDAAGNLYIADDGNSCVRKIDPHGNISTVAGTGRWGYSGDNGPAVSAKLNGACSVVLDRWGNLYIADGNTRIRKVDTLGFITTFAGNGGWGYSGDGGPATNAGLSGPTGITIDRNGNIYFSDNLNNVIRKVDTAGIISTFAGTHRAGYSGDGGAATLAKLNNPYSLKIDDSGNLYIADMNNSRIRKVNTSGIISTVCGTGHSGFSGNGAPATAAELSAPNSVCFDRYGFMYISDAGNHMIRQVINTSAINMTTFPGTSICEHVPVAFNTTLMPGLYNYTCKWLLNGRALADDTLYYNTDTINNGDRITCSIVDPAGNFPLFTDTVSMVVATRLVPSLIIYNDLGGAVCMGNSATFYTRPVNGGARPQYEWMVNGAYRDTGVTFNYVPSDSDLVTCKITSSYTCALPDTAVSNSVRMAINPTISTGVSITASANNICFGNSVTFNATVVNGGSTPSVYWKKFGAVIDSGFSYSYVPQTGDGISCAMMSTLLCPDPPVSESNVITIITNPDVVPVATIGAFPSDTVAFLGQVITLYAGITSGGTDPVYQWYKNGQPIAGATEASYHYNVYENDTLYCIVTSNAPCVITPVDTSNQVILRASYLGVAQVENSVGDIVVFPNPGNGGFSLTGAFADGAPGNIQLQIINMEGSVVFTKNIEATGKELKEQLSLNGKLAPGTYILKLTADHACQNIKLIIEK